MKHNGTGWNTKINLHAGAIDGACLGSRSLAGEFARASTRIERHERSPRESRWPAERTRHDSQIGDAPRQRDASLRFYVALPSVIDRHYRRRSAGSGVGGWQIGGRLGRSNGFRVRQLSVHKPASRCRLPALSPTQASSCASVSGHAEEAYGSQLGHLPARPVRPCRTGRSLVSAFFEAANGHSNGGSACGHRGDAPPIERPLPPLNRPPGAPVEGARAGQSPPTDGVVAHAGGELCGRFRARGRSLRSQLGHCRPGPRGLAARADPWSAPTWKPRRRRQRRPRGRNSDGDTADGAAVAAPPSASGRDLLSVHKPASRRPNSGSSGASATPSMSRNSLSNCWRCRARRGRECASVSARREGAEEPARSHPDRPARPRRTGRSLASIVVGSRKRPRQRRPCLRHEKGDTSCIPCGDASRVPPAARSREQQTRTTKPPPCLGRRERRPNTLRVAQRPGLPTPCASTRTSTRAAICPAHATGHNRARSPTAVCKKSL